MFRSLRPTLFAVLSASVLFGLAACGSSGTGESLTLPSSFSLTVTAGGTTPAAVAVKNSRDLTGRLQTNSAYTDFYLVSNDTTIGKIVNSREILGVQIGTTTVMAKDNESTLSSPAYTFTVTAAP